MGRPIAGPIPPNPAEMKNRGRSSQRANAPQPIEGVTYVNSSRLTAGGFLAGAGLCLIALAAQPVHSFPGKPTATGGSIPNGKKAYAAQGCDMCHSISGKGGKSGPDLS